ncbi:PhzF family phenazine biosynthesis protein [Actinotalea ferrariae]|uniref:PhzF family phenazine biosynthesis protein n=1 Tax=Actinotalea ferrariae TaxID=1386098 RepID=UPI001C8C4C3A|nr:PhzF family phenazine biosynthesis protein [Actinotalea ferrariae]
MPRPRPFAQVDVFSTEAYRGNPVAVVLDGDGLADEEMQRFATWTNLSETTFVLPPTTTGADYRLRIFTPGGELPFAGHPTLGSAHAWLGAGGVPAADGVVVQECAAGLVPLRRTDAGLAFRAPDLVRTGPLEAEVLGTVVRALGLEAQDVVGHQWVDNGPGWAAVLLRSAEQVLALDLDDTVAAGLMVGIAGPHPAGSSHAIEVRGFCPAIGVHEDPVTGSLNAGLAHWLTGTGALPPAYTATQGTRLGRAGVVHVDAVDGALWVGGASTTCVEGTARL